MAVVANKMTNGSAATTTIEPVIARKSRRGRRWAKKPTNPNDEFPNASLSAHDVNLIVRELEDCEKRIVQFKDRGSKAEQQHVHALIEKLYRVRWSA